MVNSGDVLLRRPQRASPVRTSEPSVRTSRQSQNPQHSCNNDSDSGEEQTRTRTPSPTPPTNFETIIKALEQLSVQDERATSVEVEVETSEGNLVDGLPVLENLARHFILNAFFVDMAWNPKIGEVLNVDSLVADFKLDRHHQYLIGTFLTRLEQGESPILERFPSQPGDDSLDFEWKVVGTVPNPASIRLALKELQTELVLEHPSLGAELNFLNHVGPQLYACMRGRVNARDVLWPSRESTEYKYSLLPYYERSTRVQQGQVEYLKEAVGQFVLALAADAVNSTEKASKPENSVTESEIMDKINANGENEAEQSEQQPLLRILEIGASGSCAASVPIIHQLISVYNNNSSSFPEGALGRISYTYSDSSSIALGKARPLLEAEFPDMRFEFRVLDLEMEPPRDVQPVYDIIIAVNALHTSKYLDDSLAHVRRLLKPGGMLAIGEVFSSSVFLECTLGVGEGWWRYADRIRARAHACGFDGTGSGSSPLLNGKQWEDVLREHGFTYTYTYAGGEDNGGDVVDGAAAFGVILATSMNRST